MDGETNTGGGQGEGFDKFEGRLDQITKAISSMQRDQETRESRSKVLGQEAQVAAKVRTSAAAVDAAERDLASAFEDGDGPAIAKAQRNLTERVAERERASNAHLQFKEAVKSMETRQGGSGGAPGAQPAPRNEEMDTKNLNSWKTSNSSWYGVDTEMTKAAHEVDQRIRTAGVITVGTPEYFKAIDRQMAQKYPTKFNSAPDTAGGSGGGRQVSNSSGAGRIPKEVIDGWARMGINTSDDKVLARMVTNRQRLADKGILPNEPSYGTVLTR